MTTESTEEFASSMPSAKSDGSGDSHDKRKNFEGASRTSSKVTLTTTIADTESETTSTRSCCRKRLEEDKSPANRYARLVLAQY